MQNIYSHIHNLPLDVNPGRKTPLIITGHEGEVYMVENPSYDNRNEGVGNNNNAENGGA